MSLQASGWMPSNCSPNGRLVRTLRKGDRRFDDVLAIAAPQRVNLQIHPRRGLGRVERLEPILVHACGLSEALFNSRLGGFVAVVPAGGLTPGPGAVFWEKGLLASGGGRPAAPKGMTLGWFRLVSTPAALWTMHIAALTTF